MVFKENYFLVEPRQDTSCKRNKTLLTAWKISLIAIIINIFQKNQEVLSNLLRDNQTALNQVKHKNDHKLLYQ